MEKDTIDRLEKALSDCRTIIEEYNLQSRLDAFQEAIIAKDNPDSERIEQLFKNGIHFVAAFGEDHSPKDAVMCYYPALILIKNNRVKDYRQVISYISLDLNMMHQSLMP